MKDTEFAVIGAGPAGLNASLEAAAHGVSVCLIDRETQPGGQLIKQTHKFFGRYEKGAGTRGIIIARELSQRMKDNSNITFLGGHEVLGYYDDKTLLIRTPSGVETLKCEALLVSTGAAEKMLLFPGNDLPGVYGAGAVQTLMNVYGVRPGKSVLMVGSGNIGLIVSYQLMQAGVRVSAIVEALPTIGGYAVHAAKVRRLGIPILTRHTIKRAYGNNEVEGATIWELDQNWAGIPGTEKDLAVDVICLATGLTPLTEILWQAGARMIYVPELGGFVPVYDQNMETTVPGVFVAGDASGVEEASTAMAEGCLAGLAAALYLGKVSQDEFSSKARVIREELDELRKGPTAQKIRAGLAAIMSHRNEVLP